MSEFTTKVKEDTPRLVIRYRQEDGKDLFDWALLGGMPVFNLIGSITSVCTELICKFHPPLECPDVALCIAWDAHQHKCVWFMHPSIPVEPVVGMLEMIKSAVLGGMVSQRMVSQQRVLLGPDGKPM